MSLRHHILLVHGNGGANTRFEYVVKPLQAAVPGLQVHLPLLPGFEGRTYPTQTDLWQPIVDVFAEIVTPTAHEPWTLYGHGIGGSMLLEWAARGFALPNGQVFQPSQIILHAPIGASLQYRFFPKLMRPRLVRHFIHWLIYQPWLQSYWERKLFLDPTAIPLQQRNQFFTDYRNCTAFPIMFDLITPQWYNATQAQTKQLPLTLWWGEQERVVASQFVDYWRSGYPTADITIFPEWDHFPMLEQKESFIAALTKAISLREKKA